MLPEDVNNRKGAKLLDLLGLQVESFLPASIGNIPWMLKVVFPSLSVEFFSMQTFEDNKTFNASGAH